MRDVCRSLQSIETTQRWINECDKLAIVVGRTIVDNICDGRRSTDYFDQFITLIVHLCVQHDAREVTMRCDA